MVDETASAAANDGSAPQDTAAAAVHGELIAIAERGLGDAAQAERVVADVLRRHGQRFAAATQGPSSAEREAARSALASAVRRAALDALPPVITPAPTTTVEANPSTKKAWPVGRPEKDRPPGPRVLPARSSSRGAATDAGAPVPLSSGSPAAEPVIDRPGNSPRPLPDKVDVPTWRRPLVLATLATLLVLSSVGVAYWALGPEASPFGDGATLTADSTSQAESADPHAAPAPTPATDSQAASDVDELQLAAPEPAAGPPQEGAPEQETSNTAAALPPVAANTRVFIHFAGDAAAGERANALYNDLTADGGYPLVVLREVDFAIAAPRIRYFHAADAEAAQRLAGFLDHPDTVGGDWTLQDFTHYRPQPTTGTLEIYVPDL